MIPDSLSCRICNNLCAVGQVPLRHAEIIQIQSSLMLGIFIIHCCQAVSFPCCQKLACLPCVEEDDEGQVGFSKLLNLSSLSQLSVYD